MMAADTPQEIRRRNLTLLQGALAVSPVLGSIVGPERVEAFLAARSRVAVLAAVDLKDLEQVTGRLADGGKFVFVNIDSCRGLAQDKGGIEYLRALGVPGIVSTRTSLAEKAKPLGQIAMQKVFVTDRSNLPRSVVSTAMSKPDLLELMPWPVLPRIEAGVRKELSPFVAAGFVQRPEDVAAALTLGASAVATSDPELWALSRERIRALSGEKGER